MAYHQYMYLIDDLVQNQDENDPYNLSIFSQKEKKWSVRDRIEISANLIDKKFLNYLREVLNPEVIQPNSDIAKKLDQLIAHYRGIGHEFDKGLGYFDSKEAFDSFVSELSRLYEEKTGIHYIACLYDKSECFAVEGEIYDDDCVFERYITDDAHRLYVDSGALDPLYGFKDMPKPDPLKQEDIDEALEYLSPNIKAEIVADRNLELNEKQMADIFATANSLEVFKSYIADFYLAKHDEFLYDMGQVLHDRIPLISVKEAKNYIAEKASKLLPYDYHLDNMKCKAVVYLNETARPAEPDGNSVQIRPDSGLGWLSQEIGNSKAFKSGVANELHNFYELQEYLTAFPVVKTMKEMVADDSDTITIPKGTRCGFFNPYDGDAGNFGIPIEKELHIPKEKAKVIPDGLNHTFSLQEMFGKNIWKPRMQEHSLYAGR